MLFKVLKILFSASKIIKNLNFNKIINFAVNFRTETMIDLFINWHVNPDIYRHGDFAVRWYGLFFVFAFYFGYLIFHRIFKKEGLKTELLDKLTMYMLVSTIIGARLGHCLFYQPEDYLSDPIEILKVWHGGLASHGAAIGILIGIWLFVRKNKQVTYMWVVDRIVIVVALAGFFIRMGNLMNSEIVGKKTSAAYGFVFQRNSDDQRFPYFYALWNKGNVDLKWQRTNQFDSLYVIRRSYDGKTWERVGEIRLNESDLARTEFLMTDKNILQTPVKYKKTVVMPYRFVTQYNSMDEISLFINFAPRLPTQIFEAVSYLLLFFLLLWLYFKKGSKLRPGTLFSIFLIILFGIRFLLEFLKEVQVDFEKKLQLNMGQLLSIPFIVLGIGILVWIYRKKESSDSQVK